jgi:hypothetical protein
LLGLLLQSLLDCLAGPSNVSAFNGGLSTSVGVFVKGALPLVKYLGVIHLQQPTFIDPFVLLIDPEKYLQLQSLILEIEPLDLS